MPSEVWIGRAIVKRFEDDGWDVYQEVAHGHVADVVAMDSNGMVSCAIDTRGALSCWGGLTGGAGPRTWPPTTVATEETSAQDGSGAR